ncbi:hypothetical protein FRB95_005743 [Tulasnella sp. JGI-2019a]|nr:hypothetical protein FRB95_005743 [Tulasnella sp. JGI-2019a]
MTISLYIIAGLLTAAVCAQHFDSVLVIEPEGSVGELGMDLPKDKEIRIMENGFPTAIPLRKRVVQYLTLHKLEYFGLSTVPTTIQWYYAFEPLLRRLVVKYRGNITFLTGTIEGYHRAEDGSNTVSGVKVRLAGGVKQEEPASFVVDATGSAQASYHKWIQNSGFGPLPSSLQTTYDPVLTYSQSVWTLPEEVQLKIKDIFPYGLHPGVVYVNIPDWSTGERRAVYLDLIEQSQCA